MRSIALLIAEKKELEAQNNKMVSSVKGLSVDSNELKARMNRDAREITQAFETKASLQREVSAMKELVQKTKEHFADRVSQEKE